MQNRELRFRNGNFRVLQFADIQEQYRVNPNTLKLMNAALDAVKPDFAVLTGDQIKGYALDLFTDTRRRTNEVIKAICEPMTSRGIPFTATFGNHDSQCGISNAEQFEMYKALPGFVWDEGPGQGDEGTFCLSVEDRILIYLFDTHVKDGAGGFGALHKNQVEWYRRTRDSYEEKCGSLLPSFAFQHIPTPEFFEVLEKVGRFSRGGIRAYGNFSNQWYKLDPHNVNSIRDFMGESPATSIINSGEVDAFLEKGEVRALFAGHNHNDSFMAEYKGMYLGFTQSCGFSAYGPGLLRGARYFDIKPDGSFETQTVTFAQLIGDITDKKLTYALYEMAPVSIEGTKTFFREAGIVLGAAGAAIGGALLMKKRK
ncbi:MAG: metallophosphoesterase family protein [Clostridia bacterium]|nr:metallophosphoesterase family protein [Clostridia bacterium]